MVKSELVKTEAELRDIARVMLNEIKAESGDVVSRYIRVVQFGVDFLHGSSTSGQGSHSSMNKERMDDGVYTSVFVPDLLPYNFREASVARDLNESRFALGRKNIPLPTLEISHIHPVPTGINMYDEEFRVFTEEHPGTSIARALTIFQQVIANSRGGFFIQSIPSFSITYNHGFMPIPTRRDIDAVCTSEADVRRLPALIRHIADPTLEGSINSATSFSQAFDKLYTLSPLRFASLPAAGIPLSSLYDVVVLTGVPAHEIFGHHFEEPSGFLSYGESGTFKLGQELQNRSIILKDDPLQTVAGFHVRGFTHFDAYGRERPARLHISDGKILNFLGGEYCDTQNINGHLGVQPIQFFGNAVQYNDSSFPQSRMSCTVLDGRTETVDLEGKIIIVPHEGYTRPDDKTYQLRSFECYIIKEGQPLRILPLRVTGGINQALEHITLLDRWSYQSGMCGKQEPIDRRNYASAPVSQFARNQVWAGQQVYPADLKDAHAKILTRPN